MEVKDGEMLSSMLSPRQRSARDCLGGWWCAHIALSLRLPINLWTIQLIVLSKNAQMTMPLWGTVLVLFHLPAKRWCIIHQIIRVNRPQPTHMNQLLILTLVFSIFYLYWICCIIWLLSHYCSCANWQFATKCHMIGASHARVWCMYMVVSADMCCTQCSVYMQSCHTINIFFTKVTIRDSQLM